jgi:outer membrane protein assembly factor BamB
MNASTGALLWQSVVANYQGTPLTVFKAVLYVGSSDGSVYALSASNGTTIWHYLGTSGVILPFDNAPITVAP